MEKTACGASIDDSSISDSVRARRMTSFPESDSCLRQTESVSRKQTSQVHWKAGPLGGDDNYARESAENAIRASCRVGRISAVRGAKRRWRSGQSRRQPRPTVIAGMDNAIAGPRSNPALRLGNSLEKRGSSAALFMLWRGQGVHTARPSPGRRRGIHEEREASDLRPFGRPRGILCSG
jgi:hypothetical protein